MPLATRCPHCETVFRIQPEHLTLHGGLARCGHCQQVFDAAHSLVDPDPELAPAIVETTPAAAGTAAIGTSGVASVLPLLWRSLGSMPPSSQGAHMSQAPGVKLPSAACAGVACGAVAENTRGGCGGVPAAAG
ncbi:zinc-ribbon domain-containing protein, partial [Burkholderia gladioli]|nr:zinc-ribbon domain-containing protein [Burkholderia gladioli]